MAKAIDIYTRVSRIGGREHLVSHEDQEAQARGFAQVRGLRIGRVLRDEDKSGGTLDREGLQEALSRVESGQSGGIIVAYLSRASRDTRQGLDLLERVTRAGGAVYAPNLPDYTTADGRMLTTIQLAIDAGYRERKREELERAKAGAIARGVPVNTRAAVGLRKRKDRTLEHDPRTAPIVAGVFERRTHGEGPAALGSLLEAHHVRTSQGSRTWSKQAVYNLLANPIYKGVLQYGGRYVNAKGVEPIVDAATWQAAQHPNATLSPARSEDSAWLLAGIVRCAGCRYCMQGTTTSRRKRIYRCTRTHAGGVCPAPARVDADAIEAAAVDTFWRLTEDLEAEPHADDAGQLAALAAQLERAEGLLAQLEEPDAQEALGDQYFTVFRDRRERRDEAAEALGSARARAGRAADLPAVETLRDAWENMTTTERRELLAARFHALSLNRERELVVWPVGSESLVGELPRRGFKRAPVLRPFPDAPRGARVLAL